MTIRQVFCFVWSSFNSKYKTALESVKYENTSGSPTIGDRTITWSVNDGSSSSPTASTTIGAAAANAPVLAGLGERFHTESDGLKTVDSRINLLIAIVMY